MGKDRRRLWPVIILLVFSLAVMGVSGWMWYDSTVDRSGWVDRDGTLCYQDFHGKTVSGWLTLEEQTYYLDSRGAALTGWQNIGNSRYYFDTDGTMAQFWKDIQGSTYFFGSDGAMRTGWLELDGNRYYLDEGILSTGWNTIDGHRRYFDDDGALQLGFTNVSGSIYYFTEEGSYLTGEATLDGLTFYFREDGILHTGWLELEDVRRYYYADGSMATGWAEIGESRYHFSQDGSLDTGWYTEGEYTYYLQSDGSAAVGPTQIDGQTHYFTPLGMEVILVNRANPVPGYYVRNLVTVTEWHQVDARCYDALVKMLEDCNAAGIEYIFNSGYRSLSEQTLILETRTKEHMKNFDLDYDAAREKALQTVAIPGTSEHHLGLAVDLLGAEAIAWLTEHCWDYGFIVRYTEEKEPITGIIDEPWHFRYVGKEISLDMKDSGLCLEEYLGAA